LPVDFTPGEVHDVALKAAETDATKRALATFGKPFGLELYRGGRAQASQKPQPSPAIPVLADARPGFHPDDTTPIPRPSTYHGRRQGPSAAEHLREAQRRLANPSPRSEPAAPPLAPAQLPAPTQPLAPSSAASVDKRRLALAEPRRLRDKAHLKFIASQPCLLCGRQPSDPHHLRFAQPRAIGMKVSDEFTAPPLSRPSSAAASSGQRGGLVGRSRHQRPGNCKGTMGADAPAITF